jgi:hypothetical protein
MRENRSGLLLALNDRFIEEMLADPLVQVREDGTVWTRRPVKGRRLLDGWRQKAVATKDGYGVVHYKGKKLLMHRVVYRAFVGPLAMDLVVNHKDGDRGNNSRDNLELVTQGKNTEHRFRVLGHAPVAGMAKLTQAQVDELRDMHYVQGKTFTECLRHARANFGVRSKGNVSMILNYKTWNKELVLAAVAS